MWKGCDKLYLNFLSRFIDFPSAIAGAVIMGLIVGAINSGHGWWPGGFLDEAADAVGVRDRAQGEDAGQVHAFQRQPARFGAG